MVLKIKIITYLSMNCSPAPVLTALHLCILYFLGILPHFTEETEALESLSNLAANQGKREGEDVNPSLALS